MSGELKLNLPERKAPKNSGGKGLFLLLVAVLAVGLINLALLFTQQNGGGLESGAAPLSTKAQKALALKLEKQSLQTQAAQAWRDYLSSATLDESERASVWYRIGKLYQEGGEEAEALACYYRSESVGKNVSLESERNRRIQECLEKLGKYAALRYELAERVSLDADAAEAGDKVLAEIGGKKITASALDRSIEEQIDQQLEQFAGHLPEAEKNKQKEQFLKNFASGQQRVQLLQQLIAEEILYRYARDEKLLDQQEIRARLDDMERKFLAQQVMESKVRAQIHITGGDVENYYKAHLTEFVTPAQARISHILVDSEDAAKAVLAEVQGGAVFEEVAQSRSLDAATKEAGGVIEAPIRQEGAVPGVENSKALVAATFATEAGQIAATPVESAAGWHVLKVRERQPEQQRSFEEVKEEAARALGRQKEQEVQETLLKDLQEKYDVVIHQSALAPQAEADPSVVTPVTVVQQ